MSGPEIEGHKLVVGASGVAAGIALVVGLVVLIGGWGLDIVILQSLNPLWASMKASTALGIAAAAGSLLCLLQEKGRWLHLGQSLAVLVLLVGGLALLGHQQLFGLVGALFDRLGQPSQSTALGLLLLACALLLLSTEQLYRHALWQWPGLLVMLLGYIGILGYTFDVSSLYGIAPFSTMALHTASLLMLLAMGVVAARPGRGVMAIITGPGDGGIMARHLLPVVLLLPPLLGKLILWGAEQNLYSLWLGQGLMATASGVILFVLVLVEARAREIFYGQRRKMERNLRDAYASLDAKVNERTALLRGIMNGSTDLIAALDLDYRFLAFNPSYQETFEKIFGQRIRVGDSIVEALAHLAQDQQTMISLWRRALKGEPFVVTQELGDAERQRNWYEISFGPLRDQQGRLLGATHIVRDISERIRHQNELQRASSEIADLYNHSPCGYHSVDADGVVVNINATELRWLGYERDEVVGKLHYIDLLTPDSRARFKNIFRKFVREGEVRGIEFELLGRRRHPLRVLLNATAIYDEQGQFVHSRTTLFDITDLRVAERKFEALLESAPDGVVITNEQGGMVLVNQQAERLFGYHREELLGQPVEMLIPEPLRAGHEGYRQGYIQHPTTRAMGEGRQLFGRRKDGEQFPTAISLSAIKTDAGLLVLSTVRDITQQRERQQQVKRLNQELLQQNKELEAVNRELEAFSYSVSHDLRAPLRAIDGFSLALLEDYGDSLDDTAQDYLSRLRGGAQRMGVLIDDLLKLSRLSRSQLEIETLSLSELAQEVVLELREADPQRSVDVEIEPELVDEADRNLIKVVFTNLLGNAWKFTRNAEAAKIRFGRQSSERGVVYYVADNGVGFDMTYQDKLFHTFQRLHDNREFPGTGIGLAIVQRVIHRHGGQVWAEGSPGEGATFYFTLTQTEVRIDNSETTGSG